MMLTVTLTVCWGWEDGCEVWVGCRHVICQALWWEGKERGGVKREGWKERRGVEGNERVKGKERGGGKKWWCGQQKTTFDQILLKLWSTLHRNTVNTPYKYSSQHSIEIQSTLHRNTALNTPWKYSQHSIEIQQSTLHGNTVNTP